MSILMSWQNMAQQLVLLAAALAAAGVLLKYLIVWCKGGRKWIRYALDGITMMHEVYAQFQPNGGGSMIDIVRHIKRTQTETNREVRLISQRIIQLHNLDVTAIWETDEDGHMVYANPAIARLADAHPNDFLGTGWKTLIHRDDREEVSTEWSRAVSDKRDFVLAFRFGNGKSVRLAGRRMFSTTGEILGWIGDCHIQRQADMNVV